MQNKAGEIEEIKIHVDSMNIETKLYKFLDGKYSGRYAIRIRDLDANENVGIRVYPLSNTLAQVEALYNESIKA